jgi:aromatic-L-amino-acid decarboxylase
MAPVTMNLVCFRYRPKGIEDDNEISRINEKLLKKINATGRAFVTHTKINGRYVIRMVVAQTNVEQRHVDEAWKLVRVLSSEC